MGVGRGDWSHTLVRSLLTPTLLSLFSFFLFFLDVVLGVSRSSFTLLLPVRSSSAGTSAADTSAVGTSTAGCVSRLSIVPPQTVENKV